MPKEKLAYSTKEAAAVLGVGMNTMYSLIHVDGFPRVWLTPKKVIIPRDKLHAWIEAQASKEVAA
ncbi:MAG: helix-turn-helix domain-containing protein [Oscillospiraceae bacterium]|nr:helix-turn-helix domain-containing protein [Oscillospiraceae bacterium]